jgi:hypothetical protein
MKQIALIKKNPYTLSFFGFFIILLPLALFLFAPEKGSAGNSWKIPTHTESNYRIPRELSFEEYEKEHKKIFTKNKQEEDEGKKNFWKIFFGNVPLTEEEYEDWKEHRNTHDLATYEQGNIWALYDTEDPMLQKFLPTSVHMSLEEVSERARIVRNLSPEQRQLILNNTRSINDFNTKEPLLNRYLSSDKPPSALMPLGLRTIKIISFFITAFLNPEEDSDLGFTLSLLNLLLPLLSQLEFFYSVDYDNGLIKMIGQGLEYFFQKHAYLYISWKLVLFIADFALAFRDIITVYITWNVFFKDEGIAQRATRLTNLLANKFVLSIAVFVVSLLLLRLLFDVYYSHIAAALFQDDVTKEKDTNVKKVSVHEYKYLTLTIAFLTACCFAYIYGEEHQERLVASKGNLSNIIHFMFHVIYWAGFPAFFGIITFGISFYNYAYRAKEMHQAASVLYDAYDMMEKVALGEEARLLSIRARLWNAFWGTKENSTLTCASPAIKNFVNRDSRLKTLFTAERNSYLPFGLLYVCDMIYESNTHHMLTLVRENKGGGNEFKRALAELHWLHYIASDRKTTHGKAMKNISRKRRPVLKFLSTKAMPLYTPGDMNEEVQPMHKNLMLGQRPVSLLLAARNNFVPAIQEAYQMTMFAQDTGLAPCSKEADMSDIDRICYIDGLKENANERFRRLIDYAQTNRDKRVLLFATDLENFAGEEGAEVLYAYIKAIKDCQNITAYIGSSSCSIGKYLKKDSSVDCFSISLASDGGPGTVISKALDHSILKEAFQGQTIDPTVQKSISKLLRSSKKEFAGLPVSYGLAPFSGSMMPIILLALLLLMLALLVLKRRGHAVVLQKE